MLAIAFSFQEIPSAFNFAASPVASLQDQWPHTVSQFGLPLGTSGELCCGSHVCVAQPKVFKGCSKGHSPQQAAVNCSILMPPARGQEISQSFNGGGKSVYNLVLPTSEEEPCTYTGIFSGQHGAEGPTAMLTSQSHELLMWKKAQLHQWEPC